MKRFLYGLLTALALVVGVCLVSPTAQSFIIGYFSRIYLGGSGVGTSTGPQIRWGANAPSGSCTAGTLYVQNSTPTTQGAAGWFCNTSGTWVQVARADAVGNDFYAASATFGAKCDGATDDTVAIQGAINAAFLFGKSGHVVIQAGVCNVETLVVGPVTNPWQTSPNDPLFLTNVGMQFTAPRSATINYTAGSTTITWTGSVITSADIGNFVFYGPADPEYTSLGVTRVTLPTYGCTVTALLTSTSATCVPPSLVATIGVPLAATTGAHASYISDDHSVAIDNSIYNATPSAFDPAHVGKSIFFALPFIRAPLDFDNAQRPGSHVVFEAPPAPCAGGDPLLWSWQCYNTAFIKTQYFTGIITQVIDPTHAKFTITGLSPGSNWAGLFPDYPVHAGVNAACGGSDPNCASFPAHEWAHLVPTEQSLTLSNPHITHTLDVTISSAFNQATNSHTYLGVVYPYEQPSNTEQRFISLRGASSAGTLLNFQGCPATGQYDVACSALIFSKNKYFELSDLSVTNASGSDPDDTTQWGIYFGGLPGVGTQALGFKVNRVGVGGFGVCVQLGDNLGGETSDADFELISVTNCGVGVRIGPGSFNTLDFKFHDLQGGLNKIGLANYSGNIYIDKGSFSFNDIDFLSNGFGPMSISNMRTEGPGIPILGGEPGFAIRSNNVAEPQATREITGNVTATPSDTHTVTGVSVSNVSVGVPANSFYPITFGSGDITGTDLRKTVVIPGLGSGGGDVVAQVWTVTSATTGTVFVAKSGAITTAGTVDVDIYDTNNCDLTFPANAITAGDIGGALALPDASVSGFWNRAVRAYVTSVTSTTTGTCGFFLGNQGAGPVVTGTSTDPHLFVNVGVYMPGVDSGATFENNLFKSASILINPGAGGSGEYVLNNNDVHSLSGWPVMFVPAGPHWALDLDLSQPDLTTLPTPTSGIGSNTGITLPWTFVDDTNQGFVNSIVVHSQGNRGAIYGGPTPWRLRDGMWANPINTNEPLDLKVNPLLSFDTERNPFTATTFYPPSGGTSPFQQLSRVKQLSESGFADGRNLRILCAFATSDTSTCTFQRSEAYEVRRGVVSPTSFDPITRTWGVNVTSGHFTQADVGKTILFPLCCDTGTKDGWFYITEIVSATVIQVRQVAGVSQGFDNGITSGTATVGQNEPDALWMPAVWGCTGLDLAGSEVVRIESFSASQVVLKSSNATSTASCLVGVIR